ATISRSTIRGGVNHYVERAHVPSTGTTSTGSGLGQPWSTVELPTSARPEDDSAPSFYILLDSGEADLIRRYRGVHIADAAADPGVVSHTSGVPAVPADARH